MSAEGWTDPEAVAKALGSLGPTAAVLICFIILAAVIFFGFVALIAWWRGIERWGIVGFGKEYQLTRMAHERHASATERTEAAQGEIKSLLAALPGQIVAGVLGAVLTALGQPPATQREPRPAPHRASSPSLSDQAMCTPQQTQR